MWLHAAGDGVTARHLHPQLSHPPGGAEQGPAPPAASCRHPWPRLDQAQLCRSAGMPTTPTQRARQLLPISSFHLAELPRKGTKTEEGRKR